MTWHSQTVTTKRELLTLMGSLATSQYVATVAVNAGGAGYVVGDIITLPHAGAFPPATFEVLTAPAGVVGTLVIRNWGGYADRAITATINAGGTGYVVGDILEVQTGIGRQMAKVRVDTEAAGVITAVSIFENGGAYSTTPAATNVATVGIGPSTFAGDDAATVDLTYSGIIGTVGLATTGGTGAGLTVDITLAETGMFTGSFNGMQDTNDFSLNGIDDEKQLALRGTVTGGDEPFIMFRTGQEVVGLDTNHFIIGSVSTSFNPAIDFTAQTGNISNMTGAGGGRYSPMFNTGAQDTWISISARSVKWAIKTQGTTVLTYNWGYAGLGNPFATTVNNPYPSMAGGSAGASDQLADNGANGIIRGPIEAYLQTGGQPWVYRRQEDGVTVGASNASPFGSVDFDATIYPCGEGRNLTDIFDASTISADGRRQWYDIIRPDGGPATVVLIPTPDSGGAIFLPIPGVIQETRTNSEPVGINDKLRMEIENMFWVTGLDDTGAAINAEDTVTDQNGLRYRVIRSGNRTEPYSLWCMAEQ